MFERPGNTKNPISLGAHMMTAAPAVLLEKARLVPLDGAPEGGFERSIAISGDVAVVSANLQSKVYGAGPDEPGAVYVFERNPAGAWRQTAKLTSGVEGDLYGLDVAGYLEHRAHQPLADGAHQRHYERATERPAEAVDL